MLTPQIERFSCMPHPALLGMAKKSAPDETERAMRIAVQAQVGVDVPLPVLLGKRIIGWVQGRIGDPRVDWTTEKRWCGFGTYDAIISAITSGQKYRVEFTKNASTAPVANEWYDMWPVGGFPIAGTYTGSALTARNDFGESIVGGVYHGGNVSAATKHLINVNMVASGGTPCIYLYDRVLTYEATTFGTTTVQQTMTNTNTAQRYISAGLSGLKIMCTCHTLLGSGSATLTQLAYNRQSDGASASMPTTQAVTVINTAAAPTATLGARVCAPAAGNATPTWGPYLPLAAGDGGCQRINTLTFAHTSQTGTLAFVLGRPLMTIPLGAAGVTTMMDTVMQVASLERVYDGACLSLMVYFAAATAATISGSAEVAWA
jgi:hypothetical protein